MHRSPRGASSQEPPASRTRSRRRNADERLLDRLLRASFAYFPDQVNSVNGLVADSNRPGWPCSIAATGMALGAWVVGVERGYITRAKAAAWTLAALRFFSSSKQGPEADATGHRGFYYHFLNMETGARAWKCELSTIDTGILLAGMLVAAQFFDRDVPHEREIRELAEALYRRADWRWAQDGGEALTHGWKPESGFLRYRWLGYDEALALYALALGSPTHPLPPTSYRAWAATYRWKRVYGYEYLYAGPLFIHQYSHLVIDFRGIQDAFMREKGIDYFENSRRATLIQQEYAVRNPLGFAGYHQLHWGLTACDGPGPATLLVDGIERRFYDYIARGVPFGPDDGTIAPWAAVASLPFAPEVVLPTIWHFHDIGLDRTCPYGFVTTYNPTFPTGSPPGWNSRWNYGLNQGPLVLMVENHRSGLIWELMCRCPDLSVGLRRAGFSGGWLERA
jgi:hypothetical protein